MFDAATLRQHQRCGNCFFGWNYHQPCMRGGYGWQWRPFLA